MPRWNLTEASIAERIYKSRMEPDGMMPAAPIRIDCNWQRWRCAVSRDGNDLWQVSTDELIYEELGRSLHAVELRTAFEDIRKPQELEAFLAICGPFRERPRRPDGVEAQRVTWEECQLWQLYIRAKREGDETVKPPSALGAPNLEALFDPVFEASIETYGKGRRRLFHHALVKTTLEAICASIKMDELRLADFRVCKLQTCNRLFEVTTQHEKNYCSGEHARQESKRLKRLKE